MKIIQIRLQEAIIYRSLIKNLQSPLNSKEMNKASKGITV